MSFLESGTFIWTAIILVGVVLNLSSGILVHNFASLAKSVPCFFGALLLFFILTFVHEVLQV